jgi:hypothetical protein
MDNIWKTFRAAKLGTSAAWALGVTSMTAMLGQSPAHAAAVSAGCQQTLPNPITALGGSSSSSATEINNICDGVQITGTGSFPTYWEFNWNDASGNTTFEAAVTNTGDTGSFGGALQLLSGGGTVLATGNSFYVPGTMGDGGDGSLTYDMAHGDTYEIGLIAVARDEPVGSLSVDPGYVITASAAPEPASLGIFGGALAALGAFRRRRKVAR